MRLTVGFTDGKRLTIEEKVPAQFSPEAQAMLDNYSTLGVALAGNELNMMVQYVDALVASGAYLLIDNNSIFSLGAVNGLIDWKGGKVATNNGATFDVNGATFNGAEWIDTNWNPFTDRVVSTQDDNNTSVFLKTTTGADGSLYGGFPSAGTTTWAFFTSTQLRFHNYNAVQVSIAVPQLENVIYSNQRIVDQQEIFKDGVVVVEATKTLGPDTSGNIYIGAYERNAAPTYFLTGTISSWLTGAAIGFDQVQYNTDLRTLLTGLGAI